MEFEKFWSNLMSKFCRNYKSVIYGSLKFYGTPGHTAHRDEKRPFRGKPKNSIQSNIVCKTAGSSPASTSVKSITAENCRLTSCWAHTWRTSESAPSSSSPRVTRRQAKSKDRSFTRWSLNRFSWFLFRNQCHKNVSAKHNHWNIAIWLV